MAMNAHFDLQPNQTQGPSLGSLTTEGVNPRSIAIDSMSAMEIVRLMNAEDAMVSEAVSSQSEAIAKAIASDRGAAFVHPYDDPRVIAGQGTVGLELMAQAAAMGHTIDAVLVCCSGGGLASGVSLAVKAANAATAVHTVEPAGFDDFARSLAGGQRVGNSASTGSICDALMAQMPGERTFAIGQENFGPGLVVTDDEVRAAMRFAFDDLKLVLEPGGAAALAAVLSGKCEAAGKTVACVLSGGNVDARQFGEIITA